MTDRVQQLLDQCLNGITATRSSLTAATDSLATRIKSIEARYNDMSRKIGRPGGDYSGDSDERGQAIGLLTQKATLRSPKTDPSAPDIVFTEEQISEAALHVKALRTLMHSTSMDAIPPDQRKALSTFNLGSSGFMLAPEMSSTILSCIEDATDITGLMENVTISAGSIKFLVDNAEIDQAAWACDSQCFANNPTRDMAEGLGEVEIKAEALRYIVCMSRDLLEDASVNVETWLLQKVNRAFRSQISNAIVSGDGLGKPLGLLRAGIPVCDTGSVTPASQFTWQDLVLLKYQVPITFQGPGGAYLMNQNTFGLVITMSDSMGRPIMMPSPVNPAQYMIAGSPVVLSTQMPDPVPGSTPVAFGNWKQSYTIANRKAVTMQQDPFSAGFCVLAKFEARIGGAPTCPNAARLLRIS